MSTRTISTERNQTYPITTMRELRRLFWELHPEFKSEYRVRKSQNQYNCDIRSSWGSFVDCMQKDGSISSNLAFRATL